MAKKQKNPQEFVQQLTPRDVDFAQWYTDVVIKTDLVDYAPVRGCIVFKPYSYSLWENMQARMDKMFKDTGHKNVYMPLLIPESLLLKEAEHVEGFAPEVAWVTHGGDEKLQERLAIRPTSETLFCVMFKKWVQSWRDLPILTNQWCSVMRWEKTTRPFLRTSEFLWQEGHTVHATAEEAQQETLQMLEVYRKFVEEDLAIPLICGQKSEKEKFAGARQTYSIEAMMQDGKALQAGTSHYFGTNFAEAFDIQYLDKDGTLKYVHETSWGSSTRMIGAIIMTHGDDRGLKLPPRVAPIQVVVVPVAAHKPGVIEKAHELGDALEASGIRVHVDDRDTYSPGWKFNDWELKGVPIRIEIGPRDIQANQVVIARRDELEKSAVPIDGIAGHISALLEVIQSSMFAAAKEFMDGNIKDAHDMHELEHGVQKGFVKTMWCGDQACEDEIKEKTQATSRNMPFDQTPIDDKCVCCGQHADKVMYFAKAY